jgi:hypothetical protein
MSQKIQLFTRRYIPYYTILYMALYPRRHNFYSALYHRWYNPLHGIISQMIQLLTQRYILEDTTPCKALYPRKYNSLHGVISQPIQLFTWHYIPEHRTPLCVLIVCILSVCYSGKARMLDLNEFIAWKRTFGFLNWNTLSSESVMMITMNLKLPKTTGNFNNILQPLKFVKKCIRYYSKFSKWWMVRDQMQCLFSPF